MARMQWGSRGPLALALLMALAAPLTAAPADEPAAGAGLAQVPADAPIVIQVRGLERTKDRLIAMVKNAVPDLGPVVQAKVDEAFKEGLEGRKLQGISKDGSIFVVFTEMPKPGEDIPVMAVLVPVTGYDTFRDALLKDDERKNLKADKAAGYESVTIEGKDVFFVDRKGYAVVTPQKEVAAKLAKKHPGLDTKLDKESAARLLNSDVALYVDMAAVNKEFGDQIKAFRPLMEFGLQQAGAQMDKNSLEMAKAFFNGLFQFVEDSRGFLIGAEFRPEGLALHTQAKVGADTKINTYLKDSRPVDLSRLGTLPAGQMGYLAMDFQSGIYQSMRPFIQGMFGAEGKTSKEIQDALDQITAAGPETYLSEYRLPPAGIQVWTYKDPAKAAAAQVKLFQALKGGDAFANTPLKEKPVIKPNAETYRNFKFTEVSLKWDLEKLAERTPQGGKEMAEAMKVLMGEGSHFWTGTDGKRFIQVTAKDWADAKKQLDEYLDGKDPVGSQKPFEEARKQLPAKANILALIDGPQYTQAMAEFMGPIFKAQGLPINIPPLKAAKGKSYFGMAVTLQPESGGADFWVPVSAVSEIRKMIEPIIHGAGIQ